jgi:hypothetical protein
MVAMPRIGEAVIKNHALGVGYLKNLAALIITIIMAQAFKTPETVAAQVAGPFTSGTLLGIKFELLRINNRDRNLTNEQFRALESAMKNRVRQPKQDFSRFGPEAGAYLEATWMRLAKLYPPPFKSFPKEGIVLTERDFDQISRDAIRIETRRSVEITTGAGERFRIKFSSYEDKLRFRREYKKWSKGDYGLGVSLLAIGAPDAKVYRVAPDRKRMEPFDPSLVISRSLIKGPTTDFIYNGCGLERKYVIELERALSKRVKDPKYGTERDPFEGIPDRVQRDIAAIVFNALTLSGPSKGAFGSGSDTVAQIKDGVAERERQLAAYREAMHASDWNIARISTKDGETFYLRIPRTLMAEETFRNAVERKKTPQEIMLVFGLQYVSDQMIQKYEKGSFKPLSQKEQESLEAAWQKPQDMRLSTLETGQKKPAAKIAMR